MNDTVYDQAWGTALAAKISPQIKAEVAQWGRFRMDPPLVPIVPGKSQYEDVVQSFRVIVGSPLSIKPSTKLAPIKISVAFQLAQQQFADEAIAVQAAMQPAMDLAFIEDAIILHGKRASEFFEGSPQIKDEDETLDDQIGLFLDSPKAIADGKSIVESILEGLTALRDAKHQQHGPYCVVVSPDLHQEAMTPLGESAFPQIAPILPQLRVDGFRYSEAAPKRTGVIFSLGGGALDLPVLWDAHVEFRSVEGPAIFVVAEQFRLRINDPRAVVTLS
jgi:uncharacterized linocin/CFP29 family protein